MELWHIGITVVDDNQPLEENIPSVGYPVTERELYDGQVCVEDWIDPMKKSNHHCSGLKLPSIIPSIVTNLKVLHYLLILVTMDYVNGTIHPGMNWRLPEGDPQVSENQLIKWLGI